jgi:hypothetical protein
MMAVLALSNESQRRIALGSLPGRPNTVLVKDGDGAAVGRIHPGSRNARGGVVTATGDVNGDLDEEVIAATPARPASPASVSVYDRARLKLLDRVRPFPETPRAGLSVAAGDIDRDGRAEIIVGRPGPGGSLVRIFRRNGAGFRTISGTLPGSLPNGVTVTSSGFNGDNYDDVAVGAGRGRAPRVVALDGFALGDPSRPPPATLFSFRAGGGSTAGVNLASGYYDSRTRPGLLANLITTPQAGRLAGRVQIWAPCCPPSTGPPRRARRRRSSWLRSTPSDAVFSEAFVWPSPGSASRPWTPSSPGGTLASPPTCPSTTKALPATGLPLRWHGRAAQHLHSPAVVQAAFGRRLVWAQPRRPARSPPRHSCGLPNATRSRVAAAGRPSCRHNATV